MLIRLLVSSAIAITIRSWRLQPAYARAAIHQTHGSLVNWSEMVTAGHKEVKEANELVSFVMRWLADLAVL